MTIFGESEDFDNEDIASDGEDDVRFTDLPSEDEVEIGDSFKLSSAVLHSTDWTTETIISQLKRGNIVLNPSFQRRDAWSRKQKSRFVESLILGLPIPQIVLAENKQSRGKYIVLDGKQRLLTLLQFWGLGEGDKNAYSLTALEALKDLNKLKYIDIENNSEYQEYLNSLLNQPVRTVVIKNWPNIDYLHLVFLRLNTGSVKLSPQELRQALFPGDFSDWVDKAAAHSTGIKSLLNLTDPDYRMRDIEILARFLSFRFFVNGYSGRMKKFIDATFDYCNKNWGKMQSKCESALVDLESMILALEHTFAGEVARKPNSRMFNRAIFDFLTFYAGEDTVRDKMASNPEAVQKMYRDLFLDNDFRAAVERDTAGVANTTLRLSRWGQKLNSVFKLRLPLPTQEYKNNLTFVKYKD